MIGFLAQLGGALALTGSQVQPYMGTHSHPTENCFWKIWSDDSFFNWVNTDSNAVYQCSAYHLPEGASIKVKGQFPHSRYLTYTLYGTALGNYLADMDIVPDEGSTNPYLFGADREAANRNYTIHMLSGFGPPEGEERPKNTLYHGGPSSERFGNFVCTRIYVPDLGTEPFGATALPEVTLTLADGTTQDGTEMCDTLDAFSHGWAMFPQAIGFDLKDYLALREGSRVDPSLPEVPHTHPAVNPPEFKAFFNTAHQTCVFFTPDQDCGSPVNNPDGVGLGNPAGRYVESWLDRGFGEVLVLRGKLPRTPATWGGNPDVPDEDYDLRYFSICPQESLATWRVGDCIFDEELAENLDADGFYNLVLTRPSWRPNNARSECGYSWAQTPAAGDGAGDFNLYNMWIRHALPSPNFSEAAQNVLVPGTEEEVMGDYYPRGTYYSVEEFESLGCMNTDGGEVDVSTLPGVYSNCETDRMCMPQAPGTTKASAQTCHYKGTTDPCTPGGRKLLFGGESLPCECN